MYRTALAVLGTILVGAGSPSAQEPALNDSIARAFEAGNLPGLHAVLAVHEDEILAEAYFVGEDERWGRPLGLRQHGPDALHDVRSVTKSVVGLLYGIALAEGKVPGVDQPLVAQFPGYADLAADPVRQRILVEHALTMRMGTEWNEDLPYSDPRNSEITMENAADRYRFALDRPMVDEPGGRWTYNGGAVALVAKLIADGVGMPIDAYARETLFEPLGIAEFEWVQGADGVPSAASGLRLTARDLARIGRMIADDGAFDGRQVVPADWLQASFTPHSTGLDGGLRYGYLFWLSGTGDPPHWVAGFGNGGQRLTVLPQLDATVVVLAGRYNDPEAWRLPVTLIEEFIAPVVGRRVD